MTVEEVAALFQVSKKTIFRWVHYDYIPHIKFGGAKGSVRFKAAALEAWVRKREHPGRTRMY